VQAVKQGTSDSKEACWAQFVLQCRNNLHVVLAMSPVGETLRTRCRNFPGLVNNTVIDWFEPWPEQALHSVATVFLQASPFSQGPLSFVCLQSSLTFAADLQSDDSLGAMSPSPGMKAHK